MADREYVDGTERAIYAGHRVIADLMEQRAIGRSRMPRRSSRPHLDRRSILQQRQSHIDVLTTNGLMAMDRQGVLAAPKRRLGGGKNIGQIVVRGETRQSRGQHAVEVNLRILIVMNVELQ